MSVEGELSGTLLKESQERQKQTLNNIQQLQTMEKDLYTQLEKSSANGGDIKSQDAIIAKINELSQIRISLFNELNDMYKDTQGRVSQSRVDLVDQMTVAGVVENELNNAKNNLNALSDNKNQKMRMVELNTYYSQKYREYSRVMKLVIYFTVPVLILAILRKKTLIPENIANILIVILILVGSIMVVLRLMDLSSRSNMNFDEYDWGWDPSRYEPSVIQYDKQQLSGVVSNLKDDAKNFSKSIGLGCIDEECCANGTVYDKEKKVCITSQEDTVESFGNLNVLGNRPYRARQRQNVNVLSYVEAPGSDCPWKKHSTTVKPFSMTNDSYVRV
jgi:hypothetical protein